MATKTGALFQKLSEILLSDFMRGYNLYLIVVIRGRTQSGRMFCPHFQDGGHRLCKQSLFSTKNSSNGL